MSTLPQLTSPTPGRSTPCQKKPKPADGVGSCLEVRSVRDPCRTMGPGRDNNQARLKGETPGLRLWVSLTGLTGPLYNVYPWIRPESHCQDLDPEIPQAQITTPANETFANHPDIQIREPFGPAGNRPVKKYMKKTGVVSEMQTIGRPLCHGTLPSHYTPKR